MAPKTSIEVLAAGPSLPSGVAAGVTSQINLHKLDEAEFNRLADDALAKHGKYKKELAPLFDALKDALFEADQREMAHRLILVYTLSDDRYTVIC